MSKAKKAYYEFKRETDKFHEGLVDPIQNYVDELEAKVAKMKSEIRECLDIIRTVRGINHEK